MTIFSGTSFLDIFVYADDLNPGVYPKDSKPFGIPIEEWLVKHTQWLFQTPYDVHPGGTYTPEKCSSSQSGPVWYLTLITEGNEQRTCTIPSDKAILLPILVGFCSEWDSKAKQLLNVLRKVMSMVLLVLLLMGKQSKTLRAIEHSLRFLILQDQKQRNRGYARIWERKYRRFFLIFGTIISWKPYCSNHDKCAQS